MTYMLDTNICIYIIKHHPPQVYRRFERLRAGAVAVSSIVTAELTYGIEKSQRVEENQRALEQFLWPLLVVEFSYQAAQSAGRLRRELEQLGTPIGPYDTLIAAHALSLDATLVTNNTREFARAPELRLENWTEV